MTPRQLFRVTLPYACFGVYVLDGRVIETAPIFRWALYKDWQEVQNWVKRKGGHIEVMP